MLSIGVLFASIGLILILFNTIKFSFIKDQLKNKKQALLGLTFLVLGVILLFISIRNLMLE